IEPPVDWQIALGQLRSRRSRSQDVAPVAPVDLVEGGSEAIRAEAVLALFEQYRPPFAFLALNPQIARGLLYACRQRGLEVGRDVSLVCLDDSETMRATDPPVTVVAQRGHEMGHVAVRLLEAR